MAINHGRCINKTYKLDFQTQIIVVIIEIAKKSGIISIFVLLWTMFNRISCYIEPSLSVQLHVVSISLATVLNS